MAVPAKAAAASISGQVLASSGGGEPTGIEGVCVIARDASNPGAPPVGFAITDAKGNYAITVTPGEYKVKFSDCRPHPRYLEEWWNDKPDFQSADTVDASEGDVEGIDATLEEGNLISGRVTDEGATGIQGICVNANDASNPGAPSVGFANTDSEGNYALVVAPGEYKVHFVNCQGPILYVQKWWNDKPDFQSADTVDASEGDVEGIDATLEEGSVISGRVTSDGTTGIQGICVNANAGNPEMSPSGFASTDFEGNYAITVAPGEYTVSFFDCREHPNYLPESWNDRQPGEPADAVDATGGDVEGIDATLQAGSVISGRVTSDGSSGIQGICVTAVDTSGKEEYARTDATGDYALVVAPGEYTVDFLDCGEHPRYFPESWNDRKGGEPGDVIDATGGDVEGIDATLEEGNVISGTITDDGVHGVPGCVKVNGVGDREGAVSIAYSNLSGEYAIAVLPGEYKLSFSECHLYSHYIEEWWNDKPDFQTADVVDASEGDVEGIDPVLEEGNLISGRVTSDGMHGVQPCALIYDAGDPEATPRVAYGEDEGNYGIAVPPGEYKVQFQDCSGHARYLGEWWNDKPDLESADVVDVTSGDAEGIDAILEEGNVISGRVTSDGTTAIEGACVAARDASGEGETFYGETNSEGDYGAVVPPGEYKVQFSDCEAPSGHPRYIEEWWNDKPDLESADVVDATGGDVEGIDATLQAIEDTASEEVGAGETVSTNSEATAGDPIGTSVTTPTAGEVTIEEGPVSESEPSGYSFLGQEVEITAPVASAAEPLVIQFRVDASLLPPEVDETNLEVFRDGTPVRDCAPEAEGTATPDPCVADRTAGSGGDVWLTVRTSHASRWNFGLDVPPETTIDSGPSGPTNDRTPTFTFSSDDPGASFECRLDRRRWTQCDSPLTLGPLADGPHVLRVRAVDAAGNVDGTSAHARFRVDTRPPRTWIVGGPRGRTHDTTPRFEFTGSERRVSFECRFDDEPFRACAHRHSDVPPLPLDEGRHVFRVRAIDAAGNADPTPARATFRVDSRRRGHG